MDGSWLNRLQQFNCVTCCYMTDCAAETLAITGQMTVIEVILHLKLSFGLK